MRKASDAIGNTWLYCLGGAVTVSVTVVADVVVPALLETTPLESIPTIVNV